MTPTGFDKPTVIDLFAGAGGLSAGFAAAGFRILAGIDNWQDAVRTFELNHPGSQTRLVDLGDPRSVESMSDLPRPDVIVGGPPCQGFSIAGKRDPSDPRNRLYKGFLAAVRRLTPTAFVMENVPNLVSMSEGELFAEIRRDFEDLGYHLAWRVLKASEFGVPQIRRRLFLVGTRTGQYLFPEPSGLEVSTAESISDLPPGTLHDGSEYPNEPQSMFQEAMRRGSRGVWNHQTTRHSERTRRIISLVPDGGNYKDLPPELQSTRRVNIAWTRLASHRPSYTIDTGHRHHFHYQYDRVPTVRESARLQSFPDSFVFFGSKSSQYRQVGNAVPPLLAEVLARQLKGYLEG